MNTISIIIPLHNSIKYLDDCLSSVITQASKDDEIILVENGSTDGTDRKVADYVNRHPNIKYIELGSVGVSVARNEGIKAATKEWITFVDSDDMLQSGAFDYLRKNQIIEQDIIVADYDRIIKKSNSTKSHIVSSIILQKGILNFVKYHKKIERIAPIDSFNIVACWAKFFRREFLISNNIYFPSNVVLSEDAFFCFIAYKNTESILSINQCVYFYRENRMSVSRSFQQNFFDNTILLFSFFEDLNIGQSNQDLFKDYCVFIINKIIETCINLKNVECKFTIEDKVDKINYLIKYFSFEDIIKKQPLYPLTTGKRRTIVYAIILFYLKKGRLKAFFSERYLNFLMD